MSWCFADIQVDALPDMTSRKTLLMEKNIRYSLLHLMLYVFFLGVFSGTLNLFHVNIHFCFRATNEDVVCRRIKAVYAPYCTLEMHKLQGHMLSTAAVVDS